MEDAPTLMQTVIARMREIRKARGMTAEDLAKAMTQVGVDWQAGVVTKLEKGYRKGLSVDEFAALALVLDVAPVHLLVPLEDEERVTIAPGRPAVPAVEGRSWVRGTYMLTGTRPRNWYSERPESEFERPKWMDEMPNTPLQEG